MTSTSSSLENTYRSLSERNVTTREPRLTSGPKEIIPVKMYVAVSEG